MADHAGASPVFQRVFRISLVVLPYVSYVGMIGLFAVLVHLLWRHRRLALDPALARGLGAIALLLLLSSIVAVNPGEAWLQLTNFLPYFLFFGALPWILSDRFLRAQIARDAVLAVIPLNLYVLVEYSLKAPWLPVTLQQVPFVAWVRAAPHAGRAMATFGHPNTLASYLVLVLGLGLGSVLLRLRRPGATPSVFMDWGDRLLSIGIGLSLLGIFCSGSRNGLLVAVSQLLIFALCVRSNQWLRWGALAGVGAVGLGAAVLGIGGRILAPAAWTTDPRVQVWQFALDLLAQRPWLGWGLGNYKLQYPPGLIPGYEYISHPHNFWLLLAVEAGIPVMLGLTVWVGMICARAARTLLEGRLKPADYALLIGYGLAFWGSIAFGLFDVTLYDVRVNAMNWIILAGIYSFSHWNVSSG